MYYCCSQEFLTQLDCIQDILECLNSIKLYSLINQIYIMKTLDHTKIRSNYLIANNIVNPENYSYVQSNKIRDYHIEQHQSCSQYSMKKQKKFNSSNSQHRDTKNLSESKNNFKKQHILELFKQNEQIVSQVKSQDGHEYCISKSVDRLITTQIIPGLSLETTSINLKKSDALSLYISKNKQKQKELQLKISQLQRELKATFKGLGYINTESNSIFSQKINAIYIQPIEEKSFIQKLNEQTISNKSDINRIKQQNEYLLRERQSLLERKNEMEQKIIFLKLKNSQLEKQLHTIKLKNKQQVATLVQNYSRTKFYENTNVSQLQKRIKSLNQIVRRKDQTIEILKNNNTALEAELGYYKEQNYGYHKNIAYHTAQFSPKSVDLQSSLMSLTSQKDQKTKGLIKKKFQQKLTELDHKVKKLEKQLKYREYLINQTDKILCSLLSVPKIFRFQQKLELLWAKFGKQLKKKQSKRSKTQQQEQQEQHKTKNISKRKRMIGKLRLNIINQAHQDELQMSI